ncbi:MAG: inorganic pyrophosphatase [Lachnospiraceae bacterium]|nr:inorganic pyrophosphatase [Lachnospiraceae bacterium]
MIGLKRTIKLCDHEKEWEREALVKSFLGKTVDIRIDRPMGSRHPRHLEMIYPINYGFIPNVYSGDDAKLDVYLPGVDVPVREYTASGIGIIYREDDVEDKLVAAPNGIRFSKEEIQTAVNFQEQFFKYTIEVL